MNILAVDTSTENLSLALQVDKKVYGFNQVVKNEQSKYIILEIENLLNLAGVRIDELDSITYNQGPGSFTGLRIGLSVILGIAYVHNINVIPIPAFHVYTKNIANQVKHKNIVVGIDARLKQVYLAGMSSLDYTYCIEPCVIDPNQVVVDLEDYICIGSGFSNYTELFAPQIRQRIYVDVLKYPDATCLIHLVNSGLFPVVPLQQLDLLYIRDKVALTAKEQKL